MNSKARHGYILVALALSILGVSGRIEAAQVFVGGNPNSVGIVDQHPMARGEALYDTAPAATGLYNRNVDTVMPATRYDAYANYWDNTNAAKRNTSLINGGWYCVPTAALSLVHYWDQYDGPDPGADPDYPNLFMAGDTNRSVILDLAQRMDTDDVVANPAPDPTELHLGVLPSAVFFSMIAYFNSRHPKAFRGFSLPPAPMQNAQGRAGRARTYKREIDRNHPVMLAFPGHMTVGIGYDEGTEMAPITHENAAFYRVNDPWDARLNISGAQLGLGRPILQSHVYGSSLAVDIYGPGADDYIESPGSSSFLPDGALVWIQPIPEPSAFALCGIGLSVLAAWRVRNRRLARV